MPVTSAVLLLQFLPFSFGLIVAETEKYAKSKENMKLCGCKVFKKYKFVL